MRVFDVTDRGLRILMPITEVETGYVFGGFLFDATYTVVPAWTLERNRFLRPVARLHAWLRERAGYEPQTIKQIDHVEPVSGVQWLTSS